MEEVQVIAPLMGGVPGASGGWGQLEMLVLAVAVVLAAILLLLRQFRSADRKKRRAAAFGYYDRDVARYANGALPHQTVDDEPLTMAPSFVAPTHAGRKASRSASPVPTVRLSGFGAATSVRAFDPVEAERLRPPAEDADDATPSPVPEIPPPPPPGARIPLMTVPPPPAVPPPPR
jgi:hypothetical protein